VIVNSVNFFTDLTNRLGLLNSLDHLEVDPVGVYISVCDVFILNGI
jgi:hypothetical protein